MRDTLTIQELAQLLNRSTKSIRNYVKAGKLKASKVNTKHGLTFAFNLNEARAFAQRYLSLAIDDKSLGDLSKKSVKLKSKALSAAPDFSFGEFTEKLISLEAEKRKIIEDYAEYKSQLAFKMGQLEGRVKLLDIAREEKARLKKELKNLVLKERALKTANEKQETEIQALTKLRAFYENRPWYQFWKRYQEASQDKVSLVS